MVSALAVAAESALAVTPACTTGHTGPGVRFHTAGRMFFAALPHAFENLQRYRARAVKQKESADSQIPYAKSRLISILLPF